MTRPEEAVRAAEAALDGVIVSNHGGHQLATIDVLPEIADAAGDRLDVMVDSGFRRGSDIAAALALGAKAILLDAPISGASPLRARPGYATTIDTLAAELRTTMQLCGARTIAELDGDLIRRRGGEGCIVLSRVTPAPLPERAA